MTSSVPYKDEQTNEESDLDLDDTYECKHPIDGLKMLSASLLHPSTSQEPALNHMEIVADAPIIELDNVECKSGK